MNFVLGKVLQSLLFYIDNPYFFTNFSKLLSLLFPLFSVAGHLKARITYIVTSEKAWENLATINIFFGHNGKFYLNTMVIPVPLYSIEIHSG